MTDPSFSASHAEINDPDLRNEIELVGDLVVAAAGSDGPLEQDEIDRVLGVLGLPECAPHPEARRPVA